MADVSKFKVLILGGFRGRHFLGGVSRTVRGKRRGFSVDGVFATITHDTGVNVSATIL